MALLHSKTKAQNRQAPDFDLLWVYGKRYSLEYFREKKWLAVIFTCNHCPYAVASRPEIVSLASKYQDIWFICINSNDTKAYPQDSYENMKHLSDELRFSFPYVIDTDQSVAKAYDAQCTPDNYLFKNTEESFKLFFQGRLNDNRKKPWKATQTDFEDHIISLLAGEKTSKDWVPSMGCSIKWR